MNPNTDSSGGEMIPLYLDPGSGSFLIQLLIAAIAGAGIAIAASWSKIKRLLNKNRKVDADNDEDNEQSND
jgi:hypothetical protein